MNLIKQMSEKINNFNFTEVLWSQITTLFSKLSNVQLNVDTSIRTASGLKGI